MIFDYRDFDNAMSDLGRTSLVCGSAKTEVDHRLFPLRALQEEDPPGEPSGPTQLCGMLVCLDCGFIRLHAITMARKRKTPVDDT